MKRLTLWLAGLFISMSVAIAQDKQVVGTVVDESGEAVIGASVVAKENASIGTVTDFDGKFTLSVPSSTQTLIVKYLGKKDQEVAASSSVSVKLKSSATELDEVTVVGYGVVAKSGSAFGAKTTVRNDRIDVPLTSFDKALQGNAAGVLSLSNSGQPGAGQQVVIRGVGTINGGSTPLYILDGIPIATGNYGNMTQTSPASTSGDNLNVLSSLNPNDIESITILKDAASTSIYGSRAANGVIYITTKQGKAGKTQFNLRLSSGFSSRTSDRLKMLNKNQYIDYLTDALVNAGYSGATTEVAGVPVNSIIANNFRVRNAQGNFYDFDWMSAAYKNNAPTTTADFSAIGGNEKTKFFFSLSTFNQNGIILNTYMKRYTGRLNLDHTVNSHVKFGVNTLLAYNNQRSPMTTSSYFVNPVFGASMYSPLDAGILQPGSTLYNPKNGAFTPLNPGPNIDYLTSYANANFLANNAYDDFSSRTARNTTGGYAQWSFLDGFILKGTTGYDYFYLTEAEWLDPRPKGNSASYGRGLSETSVTEHLSWNESVTLNYIKTIEDLHNLNILIGQEAGSEGYRYSGGSAQDFPGNYFHYMSQGATPYGVYGARYGSSLASFFSSANYNYDQKYYLSGSLRRDGSSRLSINNRWNTFYSIGASWKLKQEDFLQQVNAISNLGLRASYGTSGNQTLSPNASALYRYYPALALYSGVAYNGGAGLYPSQVENTNLKWEKTLSLDIGLDISVLDNRLGATIDWYRKDTKNALLSAQLSRTSGFERIASNVGELYNTGIEIALNGTPVRTKDIVWTIDCNITSNKNHITKLYGGNDVVNGQFLYREGKDIMSLYAYRWAGVNPADGRPMYYDKDGEIMYSFNEKGDTRQIVGSASPKFYGGLNTKIIAYGMDLTLGFYYTYGNKIYDASWTMFTSAGNRGLWNQYAVIANERWKKEGDISAFPKPVYAYPTSVYGQTTDKSIFDGSYIRLRDVTFGYNLPEKWIQPLGLTNVRLYTQGTNLLTFTKFPDYDPEVGGGRLGGYYYLGYPNSRTVTLGIDVKF